jgi:signal transduction histidine kinase
VRSRRAGGRVLLDLTDANGPVDPSLPGRLGRERFSTKPEGTGLGILFARRVAALHGGNLSLALGPDGGLAASLSLPAAEGLSS